MLPNVDAKKKEKRGPGQPRGGIRDFIRQEIRLNPKATTAELREAAFEKFGYRATIDRHMPQVVWQIRNESKIGERRK